ncbi:hypothetical protein MXB_2883 [Myxobolus squamalis]|nr:hypothetical protein MXB_2883 [Myxobolus squamalis]
MIQHAKSDTNLSQKPPKGLIPKNILSEILNKGKKKSCKSEKDLLETKEEICRRKLDAFKMKILLQSSSNDTLNRILLPLKPPPPPPPPPNFILIEQEKGVHLSLA